MSEVPLHVIHLDQDDPRTCTARRLGSHGLALLHYDVRKAPRRGFLLDPNATVILGPEDKGMIELGGALVALDCSWKKIEESLVSVELQTMLESRTLPILLASNPVSWGKPGRLSTAEALAASLYLIGYKEQAFRLLSPFPFGDQFMELNKEPLNAYIEARSRKELTELQWEFFDSGRSADY